MQKVIPFESEKHIAALIKLHHKNQKKVVHIWLKSNKNLSLGLGVEYKPEEYAPHSRIGKCHEDLDSAQIHNTTSLNLYFSKDSKLSLISF